MRLIVMKKYNSKRGLVNFRLVKAVKQMAQDCILRLGSNTLVKDRQDAQSFKHS